MKTAEFGQPCKAPEPGRCRVCGSVKPTLQPPLDCTRLQFRDYCWADETQTLCARFECIAAAREELNVDPADAEQLRRPYEGKRYGFAPR